MIRSAYNYDNQIKTIIKTYGKLFLILKKSEKYLKKQIHRNIEETKDI